MRRNITTLHFKSIIVAAVLSAVLGAVSLALAQTNGLAPGKSPDFDSNGIVGYSDFFLFAEAFGKTADQAGYNDIFDLNDDKNINFSDFLIFASYFGKKVEAKDSVGQNCKEVFPGFNGPTNERVNLVFIAFNYDNTNKLVEKIKSIVDVNDDTKSFLSFEPFKSNKNKINLWYVNKIEQLQLKNPDALDLPTLLDLGERHQKTFSLMKECESMPGNLKVIIIMHNFKFRPPFSNQTDNKSAVREGWTGMVSVPPDFDKNTELNIYKHEFTHAFGKLLDEYSGFAAITEDIGALNCDVATSQAACPKWCKGPPISVEEFEKKDCSKFDSSTCTDEWVNGGPCRWSNGCFNIVKFCTSITDENKCSETKDNFQNNPGCAWTKQEHPYYKSNCIPIGNKVNIGTQCVEKTGCYNGCAVWSGSFRSERYGMLQSLGSPLGIYNEKILCDRIKVETGSVGGKCDELFKLFK